MKSAQKFNLSSSNAFPSNRELVEQIAKSDKKAFEILFRRYSTGLQRFLWGYLKNDQLAEDVVQEVFFRVWENRHCLDPEEKIKTYIFKIGRNIAIDHIRHKKIIREWEEEKKALHMPSFMEKKIDDKLHKKLMLKEVKKAIKQLPERCRMVFILSRYEGMTYKEIAEQLEISVNTVDTQICRALKRLREQFASLL